MMKILLMKRLNLVPILGFSILFIFSCRDNQRILSLQTDYGSFALYMGVDTVGFISSPKTSYESKEKALAIIDGKYVYFTISNEEIAKYDLERKIVEQRILFSNLKNYRLPMIPISLELRKHFLIFYGTNGVMVMDKSLNILLTPCDSIMKRKPNLRRTSQSPKYQFLDDSNIQIIFPQNDGSKDYVESFNISVQSGVSTTSVGQSESITK